MNKSSITVTVKEGVFVFQGARPDGSANWTFLRPLPDGTATPRRVPRRFQHNLKQEQTSDGKKARNARRPKHTAAG